MHHPRPQPNPYLPGYPLYSSPTTLAPVLLHPNPRAKTGRPHRARNYASTAKPHRPTTAKPKQQQHPRGGDHPYGPTPKPKSLPRLAPTHGLLEYGPSPSPPPYHGGPTTPTPFPHHHLESVTAAGVAVFPSLPPEFAAIEGVAASVAFHPVAAEAEAATAEAAHFEQLRIRDEQQQQGTRRVVLPTILRSGDLFEGGEGGLIRPTIGPDDLELNASTAGFISPQFLPRANRFDDGSDDSDELSTREKKDVSDLSSSSSEEVREVINLESRRKKKPVHKVEITKIRYKS